MRECYGRAFAPVFVVDLSTVFGCDVTHILLSCFVALESDYATGFTRLNQQFSKTAILSPPRLRPDSSTNPSTIGYFAIGSPSKTPSDAPDLHSAAQNMLARFGLRVAAGLKNEVQIAELVPEIFSGDRFLVGSTDLLGRQKCT